MSDTNGKKILLAHGGGGRVSNDLLSKIVIPKFQDKTDKLTDAAELNLESNNVCFTTDSFVVKPIFFNGGDIGKLAVCGTVNDLAVAGARPAALSLSLIIEEGLEIETLDKILTSVSTAAKQAGVSIVTGDTKVVDAGSADNIFINTAGIGTKHENANLSFDNIKAGDKVIINGTVGDHGMTIMSQREGIKFKSTLKSDCATLNGLVEKVLDATDQVKFMRDPTRGGIAATLNEIATATGLDIELIEKDIPVDTTVKAAAEMLGFDPINIANEGKVVFVVANEVAEEVLKIIKSDELGKNAAIIGEVKPPQGDPVVEIVTAIGGKRIVQMPYGRELPRIC
ncbi:MAG: hydrogenase expression/formation protein HypE [Planctomycetes bacterium]|nr:hydrogenase expression/formation protein HypE [Planctomycetota bacterium]